MRRDKKLWILTCAVTILGLLLGGCAPAAAPPTATPPAPAPTKALLGEATPSPKPLAPTPAPTPKGEARYGGILKVAHRQDPAEATWDPLETNTVSLTMVLSTIVERLIDHDEDDFKKLSPNLVEKWEGSPDAKTWTLHLRRGVKWHDGKPFTAADPANYYGRMKNPPAGTRSVRTASMQDLKAIETPDDYTLRLIFEKPYASLPEILALGQNLVIAKHVYDAGKPGPKEIGTGGFKFKEYLPGVLYRVDRNPDYWMKGRPYLDGVDFYFIRDQGTAFAAFQTGRVDMTSRGSGAYLNDEQVRLVRETMKDKAWLTTSTTSPGGISGNNQKAPWTDIRVRKALSLGLDRQALIRVALGGNGEIGSIFDPYSFYALPKEELLKKPGYAEPNVAEAKKLLAEAGFPNGFSTKLMVWHAYRGKAEVAQSELAKLGIKAELWVPDEPTWTKALNTGDWELNFGTYGPAGWPPDQYMDRWVSYGGQNMTNLKDPKVDEMFERQGTIVDVAARQKLCFELQNYILFEQYYANIVFWEVAYQAVSTKVRGYKQAPAGQHHYNRQINTWLVQ